MSSTFDHSIKAEVKIKIYDPKSQGEEIKIKTPKAQEEDIRIKDIKSEGEIRTKDHNSSLKSDKVVESQFCFCKNCYLS